MQVRAATACLVLLVLGACAPVRSDPPASGRLGTGPGGQAAATGRIAGRILQPDGAPAADAEVMAVTRPSPGGPLTIVARTTSSFDGRYELTGLPVGEFLIGVRPHPDSFFGHDEASRAAVRAITLFPGVAEAEPGVPVPIFEATPTEGIDVWLLPAPRRFMVAGRVMHREQSRLRDMAVDYSDPTGIRRGVWLVTDPDGYFVLEGMPPGPLLLLARAMAPDGPVAGTAATVVAADGVEEVRLVMGPPGHVEGRLVPAGGLSLPSEPLRVELVHANIEVSILHPLAGGTAAPDGRFAIPRAFGTYRLVVHGLPAGWRVLAVRHEGRPLARDVLTVRHDERIDGVEVVIGP